MTGSRVSYRNQRIETGGGPVNGVFLTEVGSNAAAYAVSVAGSPDELYGKEGGLRRLDGYWQEQDRLLDGTVEVGYGIVSDQHRRGYASEAARALVGHAFARPAVRRVIAETYPELIGSIGVLRRCGFRHIGEGSEPGVVRYELTRAEFEGEPTSA